MSKVNRKKQPQPAKRFHKQSEPPRPVHGEIVSVPSLIIENDRKTSNQIIETLSKTALSIAGSEAAADKVMVLQTLWNMQKEAEDRQAEREFNIAKVAVAMDLPPIPKTKVVEFMDKNNIKQSRPYSDLDDIEGVLDPICRKYGITKEYSTKTDARGWACQILTVRHVGGHKEVYEGSYMPLDTTGAKNNNQAALSTAKYSRRGALVGAFNIYHVDYDLDGSIPADGQQQKADKFSERVAGEAAKNAPNGAQPLSLLEATAALERKLRNLPQDKRAECLIKNISIIDALEKDSPESFSKAAELRKLCEEQANVG